MGKIYNKKESKLLGKGMARYPTEGIIKALITLTNKPRFYR